MFQELTKIIPDNDSNRPIEAIARMAVERLEQKDKEIERLKAHINEWLNISKQGNQRISELEQENAKLRGKIELQDVLIDTNKQEP